MADIRITAFAATALVVLIAVVGCADDDTSTSTPTSPPVSATTSTPSATSDPPASPEDEASLAASALMERYYRLRDDLRQDADAPISDLAQVATSTELDAQRTLFKTQRADGIRQTGDTEMRLVEVQSVNLDNSEPDTGRVPTVEVDVCWDVSDVDILDADGKSIVTPDRADVGWIRYTVANYSWDTDPDGGWRVASSQDLEKAPCDAA